MPSVLPKRGMPILRALRIVIRSLIPRRSSLAAENVALRPSLTLIWPRTVFRTRVSYAGFAIASPDGAFARDGAKPAELEQLTCTDA